MTDTASPLLDQVSAAEPDEISIVDPVLAKCAVEIRRLGKRVTEDVVEIGRNLAEARKHAGHGAWRVWLLVEFGWSDQTARRFMHVYELSRDSKFNKLLSLGLPLSGLYQLAAPKTSNGARIEIAERAEAGELITAAEIDETVARYAATDSAPVEDTTNPEPTDLRRRRRGSVNHGAPGADGGTERVRNSGRA
jgi:hypothetical protein